MKELEIENQQSSRFQHWRRCYPKDELLVGGEGSRKLASSQGRRERVRGSIRTFEITMTGEGNEIRGKKDELEASALPHKNYTL